MTEDLIGPSDEEQKPMDERYKDFFENFSKDGEKKYLNEIKDLVDTKDKSYLVIDCGELSTETDLARDVITSPIMSINAAENAVTDVIQERRDESKEVDVKFKNLPKKRTRIRNIGSEHLNKMIELEAVLTRTSPVKPYGDKITFTCGECGNEMVIEQKPWEKLKKPQKCDRMDCGAPKSKMYIDPKNLSNLTDRQIIKIQEKIYGSNCYLR